MRPSTTRLNKIRRYLKARPLLSLLPVFLLFLIMLSSLALLSDATQNSARFERQYLQLLAINIVGTLIFITLISFRITHFIHDFRNNAIGSRLALRLVTMFLLISIVPVSAVYYFSLQFIEKGIDSWFDVRIEQALQDALELSRHSLDLRIKQLIDETSTVVKELQSTKQHHASQLARLHRENESTELTLMSATGRIIASSTLESTDILPQKPNDAILMQVRHGYNYVGLEPNQDEQLTIRIVSLIENDATLGEPQILQALYTVPQRIGALLDSVNDSFAYYNEMVYLREPLKNSFTLTLSLVLLLTLLTAVWVALFSSQRLVEPIRVLARGTRAVAAGDYNQQLPLTSYDEFGSLVNSFNDMTRKIAQARDDVSRSQQQIERERAYLGAVLGGLTSGVLTLDHRYKVRTVNTTARQILEIDFEPLMGKQIALLGKLNEHLQDFSSNILQQFEQQGHDWQTQIIIFTPHGRKVVMCHGTRLAERRQGVSGYVLVIDDITNLLQVQRDAAWSEVARRLAHEIKNPLTPIQLAAERMRHRYLETLSITDGQLLDRSTHTIIQQVQAMEEMVKAFSDYAYTPKLQLTKFNLNQLIDEVVELYRGDRKITFKQQLDPKLGELLGDKGRLRQLLHNLIKNSVEAVSQQENGQVTLTTTLHGKHPNGHIELCVDDNGPGISESLLEQLFDPYITSKPKGTGLGLAIVKKIIEEHGGIITAHNRPHGGTHMALRLPLQYNTPLPEQPKQPQPPTPRESE